MNSVADVILTGISAGDYFGISVSDAGDMNGDGFDDVIVGAEGYNSIQGRAYIFFKFSRSVRNWFSPSELTPH